MLLKTKYLLISFTGFVILFSCKSTKINPNFPFKLLQSTYYHWTGGQPGVKGTNLVIKVSANDINDFKADSIYFNNKVVMAETHIKKDTIIFMGYFTDYKPSIDLELETKNAVSKIIPINPYHLNDNEAVLIYYLNNQKHFIKISNLVKTDSKYYP